LIGDPDGGDTERAIGEESPQLGESRLDEAPDLVRVVLDEARSGEVLGQLAVSGRHDTAVVVYCKCSDP
jgi:hypothetical protein